MFESLSSKLEEIFKRLRARGRLDEATIREALREVRMALLEADVNFKVVKGFIEGVQQKAMGQEVMGSLTPGQQVIKIVHQEICHLMGGAQSRISLSPKPPTVLLLLGLQGCGKTTTAAKLALRFKSDGRRPLLVSTDIQRPAAQEQLRILAEQVGVPFIGQGEGRKDPVAICRGALLKIPSLGCDIIIVDTAGRLHIDEELMAELKAMKEALKPTESLLVADAMTGQDAVNVAGAFHKDVGIDGVILTKLDGDARGGAALSIKAVIGKPIKFVGVGEKLDGLEPFHPDRMASRILGMGDVLTLIEKAEASLSIEKAEELEKKLREERLTLEDFRDQLRQLRDMGPLDQLMGMIPGLKGFKPSQREEKELVKVEAIINSMTPRERRNPTVIDGSRRKRIAMGSGTTVQDVNRLLKQFNMMRKMMKTLSRGGKKRKFRIPGGSFPAQEGDEWR